MSNRLKLKGSRPPLPLCGTCGRSIPKNMIRNELPDGRLVCTRCAETGILSQRLACGHVGVPGMTVFMEGNDGKTFVCERCSAHADEVPFAVKSGILSR